jgi:hypothetical protein
MGMKKRRCDVCEKKRRFDADSWSVEGWVPMYGMVNRTVDNRNGVLPPIKERPKACPTCVKKGRVIYAENRGFYIENNEQEVFAVIDWIQNKSDRWGDDLVARVTDGLETAQPGRPDWPPDKLMSGFLAYRAMDEDAQYHLVLKVLKQLEVY